jgi:hypothetical protein
MRKRTGVFLTLLTFLPLFAVTVNSAQAAPKEEEEGFDNVAPKPTPTHPKGVATHIGSSAGNGHSATHVQQGQWTQHNHPNNPPAGRDQINGISASLYRAEHGDNTNRK